MIWLKRILRLFYWSVICLVCVGFLAVGLIIFYIEDDLPDVNLLNEVQLQVPLRIYSSDGELIAEYGQKRRIPVPYYEIPQQLINAVLATEDQRYFEHLGVDILGLMRASVQLVATGTKVQGGSTITMQVARNFFLSRKKTYTRKLKEILLAIKIDSQLSKEKILDLYLNKIYLGNRAYGVGAAAQVYYGKNLNELSLAQIAMIAGLPKAPSALNALKNPTAAIKRRNHVLNRMLEQNHITEQEYEQAVNTPLTAHYHHVPIDVKAPYVAEMVRKMLVDYYGEEAYTMGLNVYTTIHSKTARTANNAVRKAILAYDQRHGYRGAVTNLGNPQLGKLSHWLKNLKKIATVNNLEAGAVIQVKLHTVLVLSRTGEVITIPWEGLSWARPFIEDSKYAGALPKQASDIVKNGDIIYVDKLPDGNYRLAQIPEVEAALVSMDPQTGAIEVLVGGFDFNNSNFNRVTQAKRQPGSSFKPFVYSAALNKGFTLASIINDAPVVIENPIEEEYWRPQNVNKRFLGPTRLRTGLTKSRNLVSIRLLDAIGIKYAMNYLTNFGFNKQALPRDLSLALGSGTVTPLEMVEGYSILANGGYKVKPYIINTITNTKNEIIYQANPKIACEPCIIHDKDDSLQPEKNNTEKYAEQRISPQVAYLMTSVLKDVIKHGTGRAVIQTGLTRDDLAGKTGTTNQQKDAWFAGYNSHLATVVWVGYDQPRSLYEYAANVALPLWADFMKTTLANTPEHTMPQPPGIVSVRIDPETGDLANVWQKNSIFEFFTQDTVPKKRDPIEHTNTANESTHNDIVEDYSFDDEDYEEDEHLF